MANRLKDYGAGKDARIIIEQVSESESPMGAIEESWTTYAERWADVAPLRGREFFAAQQMNEEATTRFRIRQMVGLTPKMRIRYAGKIFNIQSIIDVDNGHREIEIMARELR